MARRAVLEHSAGHTPMQENPQNLLLTCLRCHDPYSFTTRTDRKQVFRDSSGKPGTNCDSF